MNWFYIFQIKNISFYNSRGNLCWLLFLHLCHTPSSLMRSRYYFISGPTIHLLNLWRDRRPFLLPGGLALRLFPDYILRHGKTHSELRLGKKIPEVLKKKNMVMQCVEFGLSSKRFLIPSPLFTICVTLDKLNNFSKPQFLQRWNIFQVTLTTKWDAYNIVSILYSTWQWVESQNCSLFGEKKWVPSPCIIL